MSSNTTSRKETERAKLIQEKCQTLLTQMLRDEDNKYCVDCDAKGPRWASWNLGVFLCIRCAGIHRNLGVHISRVKSVNLDTWTPEQVISLQQMGNSRARAVYEAQLPDGFRRPQTDTALESFIRAKYEHKKYLAREWVPPSPPKVDWAKEIDDELERLKRKKKAAQANTSLGIGVLSGGGDKKSVKAVPLPAPLPKPKSSNSPKTQRNTSGNQNVSTNNHSSDLLGLSSPTKPLQGGPPSQQHSSMGANDLQNDSFSCFLSATSPNSDNPPTMATTANSAVNSLDKEEQDFFNQGSLQNSRGSGGDKDVSGKLTKDSILALYGQMPQNYLQQSQQISAQQSAGLFVHGGGFTGLTPGTYMGAGGPMSVPQQHQFMTPPNSASMYNAPVMTAPAAFTAPGVGGVHMGAGVTASNTNLMNAVAAQFGTQVGTFMPSQNLGGIMATGQPASNLMTANTSFNNQIFPGLPVSQTQAVFPQGLPGPGTANLQQQFGNLNIGNVWQ